VLVLFKQQDDKTSIMTNPFAARGTLETIEHGDIFQPKFDADGLIPAIVTDRASGEVLMFAHMTADALRLTLETGNVHFWSRSRKKLWKKGEDSGNVLTVNEIRTDCDQDVILIAASVAGAGVACHTGAKSCFYRTLKGRPNSDGGVQLVNAAKPEKSPKT
jgi:phosphoribosyl-AMP cyclohydrolase